jgi:lauroyl/myristoyl acyltransferase
MLVGESPWKDAWRLVAWGPYPKLLSALPRGVDVAVNERLGRVARRAAPALGRQIRSAMCASLGDRPSVDRWVSDAFAIHFANQYVGPIFAKINTQNVHHWVRFEGLDRLDLALANGGVVVAHAHLALPQLPLHALGVLGYPVHQVAGGRTAVERSALGDWASSRREAFEADIAATLHDGRRYLRPLIRALRAGEVVFTACDGTGGGRELGRREPRVVLGRPMAIPVFPGWLAAQADATLLSLQVRRGTKTPIEAVFDAVPVARATDVLASHLDAWVRARPGEWHFWHAMHAGSGGLLLA